MVIAQHAAESLTACDLAGSAGHFIARFNDPIAEPLMISFSMIMGNECRIPGISGVCFRHPR